MSDSLKPVPSRETHDETEIQEEFERIAPELDLDMEEVHASLNRSVGALVVPVDVVPIAEVDILTNPTEPAVGDSDEILRVLNIFEGASPDDLVETWRTYGTRPVVAAGANWIGPVDEAALVQGLASERFKASLVEFPLFDPRRVTLSEVNIVFLGGAKAVVTYRVEEEYRNGKAFAGNAAAILLKERGVDWKVGLFTKRTRNLDFFEVGD